MYRGEKLQGETLRNHCLSKIQNALREVWALPEGQALDSSTINVLPLNIKGDNETTEFLRNHIMNKVIGKIIFVCDPSQRGTGKSVELSAETLRSEGLFNYLEEERLIIATDFFQGIRRIILPGLWRNLDGGCFNSSRDDEFSSIPFGNIGNTKEQILLDPDSVLIIAVNSENELFFNAAGMPDGWQEAFPKPQENPTAAAASSPPDTADSTPAIPDVTTALNYLKEQVELYLNGKRVAAEQPPDSLDQILAGFETFSKYKGPVKELRDKNARLGVLAGRGTEVRIVSSENSTIITLYDLMIDELSNREWACRYQTPTLQQIKYCFCGDREHDNRQRFGRLVIEIQTLPDGTKVIDPRIEEFNKHNTKYEVIEARRLVAHLKTNEFLEPLLSEIKPHERSAIVVPRPRPRTPRRPRTHFWE
ncbi:MAG: hypothetical protein ABH816_04140 [Candidatus Levyibacteriota bacterium]